jgi:hypothetical protein
LTRRSSGYRLPGAIAATVEALEIEREGGDEMRQAISLNNLADFAAEAGDHVEATARMASAADAAFAEAGVEMPGVEDELFASLKKEVRGLLGDDEYARARAEAPSGRFAAPVASRPHGALRAI